MAVEDAPKSSAPLWQQVGTTEKEFRQMQTKIREAIQKITNDPEIIAESEEFHKKATKISPENLIRPFDI